MVRRLLVRHGHDAPVRSALARLRDKAESIARYPEAYSMCPLTRRTLAASESVLHISENARRARSGLTALCVSTERVCWSKHTQTTHAGAQTHARGHASRHLRVADQRPKLCVQTLAKACPAALKPTEHLRFARAAQLHPRSAVRKKPVDFRCACASLRRPRTDLRQRPVLLLKR